jgi:hypothetical protein
MKGKTKWFAADGASECFQVRPNVKALWGGGIRHEEILGCWKVREGGGLFYR